MAHSLWGSAVTRRNQSGVVLVVALIVLVAMAMAGIAMVRQVTGGLGIAGNLAFKQNATSAGDFGLEAARTWLVNKRLNNTSDELVSDISPAYLANWDTATNLQTTAWNDTNSTLATASTGDATGNIVRYRIHRLCSVSGRTVTDPLNTCVILSSSGSGSAKQGFSDGEAPLSETSQPYYRITAQVTGPRNTVSYVQMIMY
jgi:Tfp pilus assembly protein PilX